jgi:DNA (cytosine-5)-methyltransferase 1
MRSRFVQVGNAVPPLLAYQLAAMFDTGSVVDLFSGCGGMSLGFELAGFESLAAVDIEAHANETFSRNHPESDAPIDLDLGDLDERRVALKEIKRRTGSSGLDVLVGGPPCQGFSTAGNCDPNDQRNRLVFSFVAAVAELKPRALLMENVAALLFRRGVSVLRRVVLELESLGYVTSLAIAHAEGYGVPQLRRRFFLAAVSSGIKWPDPWCELVPPGHFRLQPHRKDIARRVVHTVRDAISDLPLQDCALADEAIAYSSDANTDYQRWLRGETSVSDLAPEPSWVVADHATLELATAALRSRG